MKEKQLAWSKRKVNFARTQIMKKFLFSVIALLSVVFVASAVENFQNMDQFDLVELIGGTGTGVYAITVMTSIPVGDPDESKPTLAYKLWLLRIQDEADMDNFPSASGVTLPNVPALSGKYWHYIDCDENSIKSNAASEGEVAPNLLLEVTSNVLGLSDALLQFLYDNNGGKFIIVWEHCATAKKWIAGSPCSGMKLNVTKLGTDDNFTGASLSFKSSCPDPFLRYTGNTPTLAPATVAQDATAIPLTSNPAYQLTDGSAAAVNITSFSGASAADHDRVITIHGSGGTYPSTIDDDDDFVLKDGTTWTALAGAKLNVRVFKDGAATYKYVEVSRS